jgi:hypothetical protein
VIKDYYTRLRMAGNTPNVALVACMRKLLVIVNGHAQTSCPLADRGDSNRLKPNTVVIEYTDWHSTVLAAKDSTLILGICTFYYRSWRRPPD